MNAIINSIKVAKRKLVRVALGLTICKRRIEHFKRRHAKYTREHHPKAAARALRLQHRWQRRQTWLAKKHRYLQLILSRRQRKKAKWIHDHPQEQYPTTGVTEFDGHTCAAWIVHDILAPARDRGYWNGYVISGWRDPAYSESLCRAMCGQPSCPGTCAGRDSRHSQSAKPDGAVDVTDPGGLISYCRHAGIEFHGNGEVLPYDKPHCSTWGN